MALTLIELGLGPARLPAQGPALRPHPAARRDRGGRAGRRRDRSRSSWTRLVSGKARMAELAHRRAHAARARRARRDRAGQEQCRDRRLARPHQARGREAHQLDLLQARPGGRGRRAQARQGRAALPLGHDAAAAAASSDRGPGVRAPLRRTPAASLPGRRARATVRPAPPMPFSETARKDRRPHRRRPAVSSAARRRPSWTPRPGSRRSARPPPARRRSGSVLELRPALVLLDVRMPGMDGIETARRLAVALPDTVVVLISLDDISDSAPLVERSGAAALLPKQSLCPRVLEQLWPAHRPR